MKAGLLTSGSRRRERRAAVKPDPCLIVASENRINGFTLGEVLLVLLIGVVLLAPLGLISNNPHLDLFMEQLENRIVSAQERSFAFKRPVSVQIRESRIVIDGKAESFPSGIACEPLMIEFTRKGNIQKGGSTICTDHVRSQKLILQIGTGRIRHEVV